QIRARTAAAPPFRFGRPDEGTLDELVRGYEHITADPVRRPKKRNYLATCFRVHSDDFLPLVQRLFTTTGTATNLLGIIRGLSPSEAVRLLGAAAADDLDDEEAAGANDAGGSLPDLPRTTESRPDVNPTSISHSDRRPSNPDAGFFSEDELGVVSRSRTAEALDR
ncbi:MAG TPA: hypothetical protein VGQ85_08765, partial [Candidatus Limnocylindrales bacterium]|nr:hypothetical protein [Candidatus Limnocylindrales bacterium]